MSDRGEALSRNPNMCASCSSMLDGMDESGMPQPIAPLQDLATKKASLNEPAAQEPKKADETAPSLKQNAAN